MSALKIKMKKIFFLGPLSDRFQTNAWDVVLLGLFVLITAVGVVYTKHLNRSLHMQLEKLQKSRDRLHEEWTQLLLEQSTLGSEVRVEKIAREQLGMTTPSQPKVIVIRP